MMCCISAYKVSNDLDKHFPRHRIFKDCLESDVHHMTSQILLILIDFIQDCPFFVPFIQPGGNLYPYQTGLTKKVVPKNPGTYLKLRPKNPGTYPKFREPETPGFPST